MAIMGLIAISWPPRSSQCLFKVKIFDCFFLNRYILYMADPIFLILCRAFSFPKNILL
jgi:hypothetical protein